MLSIITRTHAVNCTWKREGFVRQIMVFPFVAHDHRQEFSRREFVAKSILDERRTFATTLHWNRSIMSPLPRFSLGLINDHTVFTFQRSSRGIRLLFGRIIGQTAGEKRRTPRVFGSTFSARLTLGTISNWAKRDVRGVRTRAPSSSQSAIDYRFDDLSLSRKPRSSTTMIMTS